MSWSQQSALHQEIKHQEIHRSIPTIERITNRPPCGSKQRRRRYNGFQIQPISSFQVHQILLQKTGKRPRTDVEEFGAEHIGNMAIVCGCHGIGVASRNHHLDYGESWGGSEA